MSSTMRHQIHFRGVARKCKQRAGKPKSQCVGRVACPKREYVPHLNGTRSSKYLGTGQCISRNSKVELCATLAAATAQSIADLPPPTTTTFLPAAISLSQNCSA